MTQALKVSCVMTTYRRFTCVTRSIACFLAQDYQNKELLIYNTDVEHPIVLSPEIASTGLVKVVNCDTDSETGQSYTNTGAIRRDARRYVSCDLYITWDDDDIFFPWNIQQCVDGLERTGARAWKPVKSFFKQPGHPPSIEGNYMEASVAVYNEEIDKFGFNLNSGPEHLSWFNGLYNTGRLIADEYSVPAYCFYWGDPPGIAGHKQSNAPEMALLDNFQRHKLLTTDYATGHIPYRTFESYSDIISDFKPLIATLKLNKPELFNKYIQKYTYML